MSTTPVAPADVPANEFERFLATLPEPLRDDCKTRLSGSGLSPDHPVFAVLADFYEKNIPRKEATSDFYEEALLHSNNAKQLLADFRDLPTTILARLETQLHGLLAAFTAPVDRLERTANDLARNVEALPVLLLSKRHEAKQKPEGFWNQLEWRAAELLADHLAWLVAVAACVTISIVITSIVLTLGARHLSRYYQEAYQQQLSHLEADSIENTITLNRLLAAGITVKVERNKEADGFYLVLQGPHKVAQPINSPEGIAIEVWP